MGQLSQNTPPAPEITQRGKTSGFNGLLWLLPLAALLIGLYLAYQSLNDVGQKITISFRSAEGLQAGKTKIRYKELDVGTITSVELSDDLSHVIVSAQMMRTADTLLRKDSLFWVVKPQISAAGISGLETIISGSYIAVAPGSDVERERSFTGLDEIPLTPANQSGLRLRLVSDSAGGVYPGTSIYYRGFKVGTVDNVQYIPQNDNIEISAFISEPYNKLINSNTKFWNISGFNLSLGASGPELKMQSVESLLMGGITFSTPTSFSANNAPITDNTLFTLYDSELATTKQPSGRKQYYVIYFDDSVRGLRVGSPVAFNGIDIGQVIDIRLLYDEKNSRAAIPILIEIEPDLIERTNIQNNEKEDIIAALVEKGLQASLETASLLTGDKNIRLSVYPDDIQSFKPDEYSIYSIMPSRNTGFSRLNDGIQEIVDKVRNLPFKEIGGKAEETLAQTAAVAGNLNRLTGSKTAQGLDKKLDNNLAQLEKTLRSMELLGTQGKSSLQGLSKQLEAVSKQLEETLYAIGPDSSLYYTLRTAAQRVDSMAKSIDTFFKKLDRKPNSMIFGD